MLSHKCVGHWWSFRIEVHNHSWLYIWVSPNPTWRISMYKDVEHCQCVAPDMNCAFGPGIGSLLINMLLQWCLNNEQYAWLTFSNNNLPAYLFLNAIVFRVKSITVICVLWEQPLMSSVPLSLCLSAGLWDFKHCSAHWENSGRPSKSGEHWNRCLCGRCFRWSPVSLGGRRCGEGEYGEYFSDKTLKCLTENWKWMFSIKQQNVGD